MSLEGLSLEGRAAASLLNAEPSEADEPSLPLASEPVPVDHLDYAFVRTCKVRGRRWVPDGLGAAHGA